MLYARSSLSSAILALAPAVIAAPQSYTFVSAAASNVVAPVPPPRVISSQVTGATSHGPYSGTPTTTGALTTTVLAASIPALPPNPTATTYPSDGQLHNPEPAPYTPAGGLGTNGTEPIYNVRSDFDYESLVRLLVPETPVRLADVLFRLWVCTRSGLNSTFFMTVLPASPSQTLKLRASPQLIDSSSSSWQIRKLATPPC